MKNDNDIKIKIKDLKSRLKYFDKEDLEYFNDFLNFLQDYLDSRGLKDKALLYQTATRMSKDSGRYNAAKWLDEGIIKMKRYKSYFKEEDSLKDLTDESIPQKLVDFIKKNPFPKDHEQLHKFAEEELKIDAGILEQYCYAFLTLIFCGGKSEGKEIDASKENMDIGHKIEIEHCSYDTDNKVIKAMQDIIVHKISSDHLAETNTYYIDGVKSFKDELKQEGNK